jgi:hypothetical protein
MIFSAAAAFIRWNVPLVKPCPMTNAAARENLASQLRIGHECRRLLETQISRTAIDRGSRPTEPLRDHRR